MIFKAPLPRLGFRVILSHLSSHHLLRYCCLFFLKILIWFVLTWGYFCPVHIIQIQFILLIDLFFLLRYWTPLVSLSPGFDCPDCCKSLVLYCQVRPLHSYSLPASCFLFPVFCGWAKDSPSIVSFHYVAVWTMSFHRGKWITINSGRSMFLTFIYYSRQLILRLIRLCLSLEPLYMGVCWCVSETDW